MAGTERRMERFGRCACMAFLLLLPGQSFAVDATRNITQVTRIGHWEVVQFAGAREMVYRIASRSINMQSATLTFTFAPSGQCVPGAAVMNIDMGSYVADLDGGALPMMYKAPGTKTSEELVKTVMEPNGYAFFPFKKLTVNTLLKAKSGANLAIWVPGSADGVVRRSPNNYFALDGLAPAYKKATSMCDDNR